jgi:cytochrome P450
MTATQAPTSPPPRAADGPRGHWLFGCMGEFQRDPLNLYLRANRQFGHHARIRVIPGVYVHLLTHPDAVEHVLVKHHKNYRKPDFFNHSVGALTGDGILTSEGDTWLRQRRLMQPAFQRQQLAGLVPVMVNTAEALTCAPGEVVDIQDLMMKLTLRIAGLTLFSSDITDEAGQVGRAFKDAFVGVNRRMNTPPWFPSWLPTPANLRFWRARRVLDRFVGNLIAVRRASASPQHDLLSLLIAAQDEQTATGMTDAQVRNEAMTLLFAGHDTVGAALSWAWYLLGKNPTVQQDVADEVCGRLQGRSPTADDLPHLPLLRATFEETLRLYPPAWGQPREAIGPDEIDGVAIPAKVPVTVSQYVTQRHPDFWDEPEEFRPERFLPGRAEGRHRFAYFPFGGGPRICIGNTFAMLEGPLVLATLLQRFRAELVPGQNVVPDPTFTLKPRDGVRVALWPRA